MDAQVPNKNSVTLFRLFIALRVPEEVKEEIRRAQAELRRELPERCARWNPPEQLHLTLKFLGNVDVARVAALTDAVRMAGAVFAPLKLRAERMGCFPDLRFPRVVWVGVHDAEKRLADLAKAVANATAAFSEAPREENFTGHITIARFKNLRRREAGILARLVSDVTRRAFGGWTAEAIEIMRSELSAGGARHASLARLPLSGLMEPGAA